MEYFMDAKCFVYNETTDSVEYKESYEDHIDPARLLPGNNKKFDAELFTSLTTWRPGQLSEEPEHVSDCCDEADDKINYIMSAMFWKD